MINNFKLRILYPYFYGMKIEAPLNYMDYNKVLALDLIKKELDFKDYGSKHTESRFTKFHQNYYLPRMCLVMRSGELIFSSLVVAGHITREEALLEISLPLYKKQT